MQCCGLLVNSSVEHRFANCFAQNKLRKQHLEERHRVVYDHLVKQLTPNHNPRQIQTNFDYAASNKKLLVTSALLASNKDATNGAFRASLRFSSCK